MSDEETKTMIFIGGPMHQFIDKRYTELKPVMTFVFYPDKKKMEDDPGKMVKYQFVHFQDDVYYYEFADEMMIIEEDDDEEESL